MWKGAGAGVVGKGGGGGCKWGGMFAGERRRKERGRRGGSSVCEGRVAAILLASKPSGRVLDSCCLLSRAGRAEHRIGLVTPQAVTPLWAGPAPRAATGQRPDRLGQGPYRPVQAPRARRKGGQDSRGQAKRERDENEKKRASRQRVGHGYGWRSQCRAEIRRGQRPGITNR